MTRKSFIQDIINDVTVGGLLPLNIPTKRIEKILKDAIKKFHENDNRGTIENIIFIDTSKLKNNCSVIKMPEEIKAITRLEHTSTSNGVGFNGDGYSTWNGGGRSGGYGYGTGGILTQVSIGAYNSLLKLNSVRFIPYDFSEYSHELVLEGKPHRNLFAEVAVKLDESALYNILDFEQYIGAKLTLDFVKVNNFIKTKLIGNREINFDDMKTEAKDFITKLEKRWDDEMSDGVMLLD